MKIDEFFWTIRKRKRKRKKTVRPIVIKIVPRQTGKTTTSRDRKLKAMKPGKRRSKTGRIYYEYRKNRSDLIKGI